MGVGMSAKNNDSLVEELKENGYIKTEEIESIFRSVDRGFYFLPDYQDRAYLDLAWRKGNLHISAPCIYGTVMENLVIKPGMSFLNIGSGTGYLSTMVGLILGPYGVNHGVEIHTDLITYANQKLYEFKRTSPAIDAYEFCEPVFIKGNCFCLQEDSRLYDRVYCGAACPDSHEGYMQNLIKVGGVLVMPRNDRLLKIIRTSETSWISIPLLPVSYLTLMNPHCEDMKRFVSLPEVNPRPLQELCRHVIRVELREEAEREYTDLTVHKKARISVKRKRGCNVLIIATVNSGNIIEDEGRPDNIGLFASPPPESLGVQLEGSEEGNYDEDVCRSVEAHDLEEECGRTKILKIGFDEEHELENSPVAPTPSCEERLVGNKTNTTTKRPSSCFQLLQEDSKTYSEVMREKIKSLPIPKIVKDYLNNYRPF